MKKKYVKPEMQVSKIEVCNMIAMSTNVEGLGSGGSTSSGNVTTAGGKSRSDVDTDNIENGWVDGLW